MKKIFYFNCIVLLSIILFYGCQKKEQILNDTNDIPDWVSKKIQENGRTVSTFINKKVGVSYLNNEEKEIDILNYTYLRSSSIPCDATEDDFLDNTFTFATEEVNYSCNYGFTVKVTCFVSTAFAIELSNPNNSSQLTRGRLRVLDGPTGSILHTNSSISITANDITNLGVDPLNSDKTLYKIVYTSPLITGIDVSNCYFEHRPIVYSDCSDVVITPSSWVMGQPWVGTDACDKIDHIQIIPNGSNGIVYFNGCDAQIQYTESCYQGGSLTLSRPHSHEIEWRTSSTNFQKVVFNDPVNCVPDNNLSSLLTLPKTITTGNIIFRYRNVKRSSSSCTATFVCNGPWSDEITVNVQ